jgi:hypothetical protein
MRGKLGVGVAGAVVGMCTMALAISAAPAASAGPIGGATAWVAGSTRSNGNIYPDAECQRLVEYYHSQGRGARCEWHPPIAIGYSELHVGGTGW